MAKVTTRKGQERKILEMKEKILRKSFDVDKRKALLARAKAEEEGQAKVKRLEGEILWMEQDLKNMKEKIIPMILDYHIISEKEDGRDPEKEWGKMYNRVHKEYYEQ